MLSNRAQTTNPMEILQTLNPSKNTELLMTTVPPPSKDYSFTELNGLFEGPLVLGNKKVDWPTTTNSHCLHCADACTRGPCLPAAKYFDSQKHQYWVFGPFCSSPCVYAYLCDHNASSKQMATTHCMLRDYFGISSVRIGAPRAAYAKFGGTLTESEFRQASVLDVVEAPFVTFSQYIMAAHKQNAQTYMPQSAGALTNLTRPAVRTTPLATKESTGAPPMLLEFLAQFKDTKKRPREEKQAGGSLARFIKQGSS